MTRRRIQDMAAGMLVTVATATQASSPYPTSGETYNSAGALRLMAASAWETGATGQGVVIGVIDTGVNASHLDLKGRVLPGYNALNGSTFTGDGNGHGTHVAGILGGASNNSGIVGLAYDAQILPVKIFDAYGNGTASALSAGIRYTARKAKILNLSLGAAGPVAESALRSAVSNGQLIVAAAGNAGLGNPDWPARYATQSWANRQIIAVGAVNANNRLASWSNRAGVTRNFYLVAPGTSVLSTYKSGYAYMSGTSMATPYVSGAAAVVWSNWPCLNARQVAAVLFKTATDLGSVGIDAVYGRGLVNLERAMQPIGTTSITTASTSTTSSTGGTSTSISTLSSWVAGQAYAASVYDYARNGGFTVAVTDEIGRDFQTDLGGLLAAPRTPAVEALFGQMEQQMSLSEQVLADGTRLTFAPSALSSDPHGLLDTDDDARVIPGGFAFSAPLANGAVWGAGVNGFADRFFGVGAAQFTDTPAFAAPALSDPLFALVPQHSHLGYAYGFDQGLQLRVGLLSDGLDRLYDPAGSVHETGSRSLWTTELSQQTASRYLSVSVSQLREDAGLLGSEHAALFGLNTPAVTTAASVQGAWRLAPNLALAGRYTLGYTPDVQATGNSLVDNVSGLRSEAFALSLVQADAWRSGDRLSVTLSQPLRATAGTMNFTLPVGMDAEGHMHYAARTLDLDTRGRELRTELNYTTPLDRDQELGIALAHRSQPDHAAAAPDQNMVAVRWQLRF